MVLALCHSRLSSNLYCVSRSDKPNHPYFLGCGWPLVPTLLRYSVQRNGHYRSLLRWQALHDRQLSKVRFPVLVQINISHHFYLGSILLWEPVRWNRWRHTKDRKHHALRWPQWLSPNHLLLHGTGCSS